MKSRPRMVTIRSCERVEAGPEVLARLNDLVRRLTRATGLGLDKVVSEAEAGLAEIYRASIARIIVHAGGKWHGWEHQHALNAADVPYEDLPQNAQTLISPAAIGSSIFLPIRQGALAALIENANGDEQALDALCVIASCIDLAITTCEERSLSIQDAEALRELQNIASSILQNPQMDDVLITIAQEAKRLLASDICGVMLRDGESVVMRHCVGNLSIDTAKLRMQAGQGVAGRVLATQKPLVVPNYLESTDISQDFFYLASIERVRSALAVPILSAGEIIGVLEVWRRGPASFKPEDNIRLLALAGLASLALDNLARHSTISELIEKRNELEVKCAVGEASIQFQKNLIELLLGRNGLDAIAREAARECDGAILILSREFVVEAAYPDVDDKSRGPIEVVRRVAGQHTARTGRIQVQKIDDRIVYVLPILIGNELHGFVVCATSASAKPIDQHTLSPIATVVALHVLERRSMARAKAESIQAVLWSLLEGNAADRKAATDRARELGAQLKGELFVIVCRIDGPDTASLTVDRGTECDERSVCIVDYVRSSELGNIVHLAGARGSEIRIVGKAIDKQRLLSLAERFAVQISQKLPDTRLAIGISAPCKTTKDLATGYRQARIAVEVAVHRHNCTVAHYDDVGLVGLLINLRDAPDLRRLCDEILGDLIKEPPASKDTLVATLIAFFEANCSQVAAAAKLGTHQKTVAYRMAKISRLSGLDLNKHQDRLLADLAIKIYSMIDA